MKDRQDPYVSKRVKSLLTFPGEQLILLEREHWSVLIIPVLLLTFLYFFFVIVSTVISMYFFNTVGYALASGILFTLIATTILTKMLVDWYFHMYIITNKKVLEVLYSPLFSDQINDVLLSQVKCAEIDAKIDGIIKQFLDVGDVVIEFDKLAPHEEFTIRNVKFPRKISMFLADKLSEVTRPDDSDSYYLERFRRPLRQASYINSGMEGGGTL